MKRGVIMSLLCCACHSVPAQNLAAHNPFAPVSWQPAAPQTAAPAPRRAASAPPLPFKYLGRYTAGVPMVVLTVGERMIVAKAGDTLEGAWRIDSLGPAQIEFTHLPLQVKRLLPTGDAG